MRLGIDFGTTRTIVSWADRGNYPVVSFADDQGDARDYLPTVACWDEDGDRLVFGHAALAAAQGRDAGLLRSFKRLLADPDVSPHDQVTVGQRQVGILDLLTQFASFVKRSLHTNSTVQEMLSDTDPIEAVIGVPAHAHGTQRFLTLEAFRRAGFRVTGLMNEPSAAGFEYTHRQRKTVNSKRTQVLVYDLGGGTFDASLVSVDGTSHEVLGSLGINRLGGDDFDELLAECSLSSRDEARASLGAQGWKTLLDECREAKERLSAQSRRIAIDVDGESFDVTVDEFYKAATPLVERTVDIMEPLVSGFNDDDGQATIAGIYLVGGGSGLPLVPRVLRARFGRRVHRSPHPAASTAIGLAIAGDDTAGYSLSDRLSRGFGVFRERDSGQGVSFDPLLSASERFSPKGGSSGVIRTYRAAHNIGWFRFVEYTEVNDDGQPVGDLAPFGDLVFPFSRELQGTDVTDVEVQRTDEGPLVEESYSVDQHGIVQVTVTDLDSGYRQSLTLNVG